MKSTMFKVIMQWLEVVVSVIVALGASAILAYELISGPQLGIDTLTRVILALVAGIAISRTLERYVTLRGIEEQTAKLSEMSNIELLRSARDAGVVDLFRRANAERLDAIMETIRGSRGTLDICGVALPTMTVNEHFREAVLQYSQRHDIRILLLNPSCDEATRRAAIEAPLNRRTISDIEDTRDWLLLQMAKNKRFRLHLYDLPPMLNLIITDQFAFVEPYHFGRPEGLEGCIGGHLPMLKIRNQPEMGSKNPYAFLKEHFEYLWNYTRGRRVNLPISLIEAKPSTYVVFENQLGEDVEMAGWELTGQDSQRPFEFAPDFRWREGERIAIAHDSETSFADVHRVLIADKDFMGNNSILRLTSYTGTLVAEWSITVGLVAET
jgi:hypothetical protein